MKINFQIILNDNNMTIIVNNGIHVKPIYQYEMRLFINVNFKMLISFYDILK